MSKRLEASQKFRLTRDALDNYRVADVWYTVASWSDHYVPSREYFANPDQHPHGHPGYDECERGRRLYDIVELPFAVYEWEIRLR